MFYNEFNQEMFDREIEYEKKQFYVLLASKVTVNNSHELRYHYLIIAEENSSHKLFCWYGASTYRYVHRRIVFKRQEFINFDSLYKLHGDKAKGQVEKLIYDYKNFDGSKIQYINRIEMDDIF